MIIFGGPWNPGLGRWRYVRCQSKLLPRVQPIRAAVVHVSVDVSTLSCLVSSAMAAPRLFLRTLGVKSSLTGLTGGVHGSLGFTLLKLSPGCTAKPTAQRRHAAHFTYHPDPVPTQYGKCPCLHSTGGLDTDSSELFMQFSS